MDMVCSSLRVAATYIVRYDLVEGVLKFFSKGRMLNGINNTIITFIEKWIEFS